MPGMDHMNHAPTFLQLWRPDILLLTVILGWFYFFLIGPMRKRFKESEPVGWGRKSLMLTALVVFYAGQGSPLSFYGHVQLFSAHMMQQSLLYLILPPLVYTSLPAWLVQPLLERRGVKSWLRPLTHPLISVLLFNGLFSFYHVPNIFDAVYHQGTLHILYHWILFAAAFHMWFPVFCPVPGWSRLSELQKLAYIFANGVLLTPACALIIFSDSLIYNAYADAPHYVTWLTPLEDQQLGGTLMKIIQEIVYAIVLAIVFFRWYRTERKNDEEEDDRRREEALMKHNHLPTH